MPTYSLTAKRTALAIAAVAAATLLLRIYLASSDHGSVLAAVSYLSQFFTILTNALVMIVMLFIGLGRRVRSDILTVTIVAITCVGILYHTLLAHLWSPQGLAMIADQGVHTVVPVLALIWWLVFADMCAVKWADSLRSAIWPLIYVSYALIRAEFTNFYPYPFLNLTTLGGLGLAKSVLGLSVVFIVLGLIAVAIARSRCSAKKSVNEN